MPFYKGIVQTKLHNFISIQKKEWKDVCWQAKFKIYW